MDRLERVWSHSSAAHQPGRRPGAEANQRRADASAAAGHAQWPGSESPPRCRARGRLAPAAALSNTALYHRWPLRRDPQETRGSGGGRVAISRARSRWALDRQPDYSTPGDAFTNEDATRRFYPAYDFPKPGLLLNESRRPGRQRRRISRRLHALDAGEALSPPDAGGVGPVRGASFSSSASGRPGGGARQLFLLVAWQDAMLSSLLPTPPLGRSSLRSR